MLSRKERKKTSHQTRKHPWLTPQTPFLGASYNPCDYILRSHWLVVIYSADTSLSF